MQRIGADPLATALRIRMQVATHEQRVVRAACMAYLAGLSIDAKRQRIISQFLDVYLPLQPTDACSNATASASRLLPASWATAVAGSPLMVMAPMPQRTRIERLSGRADAAGLERCSADAHGHAWVPPPRTQIYRESQVLAICRPLRDSDTTMKRQALRGAGRLTRVGFSGRPIRCVAGFGHQNAPNPLRLPLAGGWGAASLERGRG